MSRNSKTMFFAFLIVSLIGNIQASQWTLSEGSDSLTIQQEQFIKKYIEIINSEDEEGFKSIIYPICLEKLEEQKVFFYTILKSRFQNIIPGQISISVKRIGEDESLPFESTLVYPVRPTNIIMINYEKPDSSTAAKLIQVLKKDGEYFEVLPYPDQELLKKQPQLKSR